MTDYELFEQTWTKDKPVKFSAMLISKGTPVSGWSVNFYSLQTVASDRERVADDTKANNRYLIVSGGDSSYHFSQLKSVLNNQDNSTSALKEDVKVLNKQMMVAQKAADTYQGKGADGEQMTREDAFKRIHQQRDGFNEQNDSETLAVKYDKEVHQSMIATCHKQSEECYEAPIQQERNFDINEQWQQAFLQSQKLNCKLQDDWTAPGRRQYPSTMKVSEINSKKVAILMKADDINQTNKRWKEDTEQLRRNGVIK